MRRICKAREEENYAALFGTKKLHSANPPLTLSKDPFLCAVVAAQAEEVQEECNCRKRELKSTDFSVVFFEAHFARLHPPFRIRT